MSLSVVLSRAVAVALATGAVLAGTGGGLSCGYHSPVHIQRGMLNWTYPDALHVRTAVWRGTDAGILPKREANAPDLLAYHKTVVILQRWRTTLQDTAAKDPPPAFSIVFIDTMLWSRFATADGAVELHVHQGGPQPDDLVVVSDEAVIAAILSGQVQARDAAELGLIRLYGDADSSTRWLRAIGAATAS